MTEFEDVAATVLEIAKRDRKIDLLRDLLRKCRPIVMCHSPTGKPFDFPRELIDRIDAALVAPNVGGEHLDAVRRRVCSSDALNGKGGGGSRKVSMPTAERPTKRD
ncbi:hypothetical protein, partial [Candidatus Accumulibacter phosphatis]|uniref:hypothetical protein n=1 Tax=Candidatus Accumulibacter phosphatis TaxID=327160 RepID=UPI00110B25F6